MFTWICPKCGREVPPAYTECPDCAAKNAPPREAPPLPVAEPVPAPSQPQPAPPPQAYAAPPDPEPPAARLAPAPPPAPRARPAGPALPVWLLAPLFALAFLGLVLGVYWLVGAMRGGGSAVTPTTTVESPAAKPGASTNPLQKFIEVAGVRFVEDPKNKDKVLVRFVLINHSDADVANLAGNVTVWARTPKSEEDAQGTFSFTTPMKPDEVKELTAPLATKVKIYALPDWQFLTTDLQITAPGGSSPGTPAPR